VDVPGWVWLVSIGLLVAVLVVDLLVVDMRPHAVSMAEAGRWVVLYVALAVLVGLGVWLVAGGRPAWEFTAGYITEYSLSVDNLFVFLLIMSAFRVPVIHQHRVLLVGVALAVLLRGVFIAAGAAAIDRFSWVFYLFGGFLVATAVKLVAAPVDDPAEFRPNAFLRMVGRVLPVSQEYAGARVLTRVAGRRVVTPMLIVMITIGTTDLLFALDSIPAIFGLTRDAYLVFISNALALMGLRQLYFLVGGLISRLVYLSAGLSVILAFIGVKLVLQALHENTLPFLNGGRPVPVPVIGIELSLGVIIGVLAVTTLASLARVRWQRAHAARLPAPHAARPGVVARDGRVTGENV
jgi:tellurite resistance protein TerC